MKKIAMSALLVGALGLSSVAATSPAEAHWRGDATTTYYTAPVSYGYRYRRVVRPAYAYYRGSYPVVRQRWHHHH